LGHLPLDSPPPAEHFNFLYVEFLVLETILAFSAMFFDIIANKLVCKYF
jgi:hypothetical protein